MTARVLLLAGAAIFLPALAPLSLAGAVAPEHEARFAPPTEGLILTRTVIRELSDGKQIKVTRRYAVQFAADDRGYRLDGKLVGVSVDAPPILNNMAEIERRRNDPSIFPVYIDSTGGVLVDSGAGQGDRLARDQMADEARGVLTGSGMPEQNLQFGSHLISQVSQSAPGSPWPIDLFRVRPGEHHQARVVTLPGGGEGRVEVVTKVDLLLPCGLPRTIERTIVTLLSGSKRVSHEIWAFQLDNA